MGARDGRAGGPGQEGASGRSLGGRCTGTLTGRAIGAQNEETTRDSPGLGEAKASEIYPKRLAESPKLIF